MPALMVSHDQKHCHISFQLSWLKEYNDDNDTTVGIMCPQHHCQWCDWPKSDVAPYFNYSDLRNAMMPLMTSLASHDTDANTNGISWPKVELHLISVV